MYKTAIGAEKLVIWVIYIGGSGCREREAIVTYRKGLTTSYLVLKIFVLEMGIESIGMPCYPVEQYVGNSIFDIRPNF
jgi:hypothetical protein